MDYGYQLQMQEKLEEMVQAGAFDGRYLAIFGSNEPAEQMIAFLERYSIRVNTLLDNNTKKIGLSYGGIPIQKPEEALGSFRQDALILIISKHYYEMLGQLQDMGYREGFHVVKVVEMSAFACNSLSEETFRQYQESAVAGGEIYERIRAEYPQMDRLFLLPVRAIGDVFLGAAYAGAYMKKCKCAAPIFAVVGGVCGKAVRSLGYGGVVTLDSDQMRGLEQFCLLTGKEYQILDVNHKKPYTCGLGRIGNFKGLDFASLLWAGVYGLDAMPDIGEIRGRSQEGVAYAMELLGDQRLTIGKTIILAPYAKTAARIGGDFWERVAGQLKEAGYQVCTNVAGESETAIPGTEPLSFTLEYAVEVLEAAGGFVGLRSGFCDLVAVADCPKVILYPDRIYGAGQFIDFFSLVKMGLTEQAVEIIYREQEEKEILSRITGTFLR